MENRSLFRTGAWLTELSRLIRRTVDPHGPVILTVVSASVIGALLAGATTRIESSDRIVVGNTGGTLSTLLEFQETRILIGAGPSRSHAADLIGRTTRPWAREIDLLVIPGWDDHHVIGALGLLERQRVGGIAVIGLPGEQPGWTLLEREAELLDIPTVYLDRSSELELSETISLGFSELERGATGAWVRVQDGDRRIDIVDTDNSTIAGPDPRTFDSNSAHVLINSRNQQQPRNTSPALLIAPAPNWQQDFTGVTSRYLASIERNQHVVLSAEKAELRIPFDEVEIQPE